ncbi:MAG TPA: beta-N-acetylhexosaminidase [Steroidobacteraceae bacterium]|nr:beta-N-acetylhexosaminidase [Steroidobacteraceae bacterium]
MTLGPVMLDLEGASLTPEEREILRHPLVGGVILFRRNFVSHDQVAALIAEVRALRQPQLLIGVDQEGGRVQRFREGFTTLPSMRLIGHRYDMERAQGLALARQCGWLMAAEMRAIGVDLSFAPVVDLDYGVSEVIGDRAFHRTARAVAELAVAFVHGMRDAGMAATAKHFPGHGAVAADSHVAFPVDRRRYTDLADDLYPYERLIDNGLAAVMMSHVVYPEVDGNPAGFSRRWIVDELRNRLGFEGAIFSDDLSMVGASVAGTPAQRARAALAAGCDVVLVCNDRSGALDTLAALEGYDDPVSQMRLARLRGRPAPARETLLASAEWQRSERAIAHVLEPPELRLDA